MNRNEKLENAFQNDQAVKDILRLQAHQAQMALVAGQQQARDNWEFSREEIISTSERYECELGSLKAEIVEMEGELVRREVKYEAITNRFNSELREQIEETKRNIEQAMAGKIADLQK